MEKWAVAVSTGSRQNSIVHLRLSDERATRRHNSQTTIPRKGCLYETTHRSIARGPLPLQTAWSQIRRRLPSRCSESMRKENWSVSSRLARLVYDETHLSYRADQQQRRVWLLSVRRQQSSLMVADQLPVRRLVEEQIQQTRLDESGS